ncbi:hypothetical protein CXB51_020017 [Gossypium anomalum]|uniref:Cystatin domain-containing protein n=1 Tax=Gossypium anomalum TaxID=47600 RepID=A0A8J5YAZ3_9ROSI|nr:hypothetical protein CXB51_020017 [Gossypium anomalum]
MKTKSIRLDFTNKERGKLRFCSLPGFLTILSLGFSDARKVSLVRERGPIKDITSPRMTQLAEFAKSDYNKVLSPSGLKLRRVMTGQMKVVHGVKYKLDCNKIVCPMPSAMVFKSTG